MSGVGTKRQQILDSAQTDHGVAGSVAWHQCDSGLDLDISEDAIRAAALAITHNQDQTLAAKIAQTIQTVRQSLHVAGDPVGAQSAARAGEVFRWALRAAAEEPGDPRPSSISFQPVCDPSVPKPGMSLLHLRALVLRARNNKEIGDRLHEETRRMRTRLRGSEVDLNTRIHQHEKAAHTNETHDRDDRWRQWNDDEHRLREIDREDWTDHQPR
jgi:hypothetical protein